MSDVKFKIKETAGADHEMHMKLTIEGNSNEVKRILRNYLDIKQKVLRC